MIDKKYFTTTLDEKDLHNVTEKGGSDAGNYIPFLTISHLTDAVVEDVRRIKRQPLVPSYIPVYGYVFDVKSGKLIEVPEAMKAGEAS